MGSVKLNENDEHNCNDKGQKNELEYHGGWGIRHIQAGLLFASLLTAYSVRAAQGVALVAMCTPDHAYNATGHAVNATGHVENATGHVENATVEVHYDPFLFTPPFPTFSWDKKTKDLVLSSFFWGYMLLQIPAGALVLMVGPLRLLVAALSINAVGSILMPWIAYYGGWAGVAWGRAIMGGAQACIVPGTHTLLARWAPQQERARLAGTVYGATALSTVVAPLVAGWASSGGAGWPGLHRTLGAALALVAGTAAMLGADSPAAHPRVGRGEAAYILGGRKTATQKVAVPWRNILRSRGLWAIVFAHISSTWGQIFLFSEVPAYMSDVMHVNIKNNGLLTALPFLAMWLANFVFSFAADALINRHLVSMTTARKLFNTMGGIGAGVGLIALCWARNLIFVETALVVVCIFKIAMHMGFQVNHIDISPQFAGTMMSISNFASNGLGSFAPIVSGLLIKDPTNATHWHRMFYLSAAVYFICSLVYVAFGTAERAEWDEPNIAEPYLDLREREADNEQSCARDKDGYTAVSQKDVEKNCYFCELKEDSDKDQLSTTERDGFTSKRTSSV